VNDIQTWTSSRFAATWTLDSVDAVVLARAGLLRLGLGERSMEILSPDLCLPAVGQGALAIERRKGDARISDLLAPLEHHETRIAVQAERGLMIAVEGNCQLPVAAYAERDGNEIRLRAFLADPDGKNTRRGEERAPWPWSEEREALQLGVRLGSELAR
jgi:hydroxymethylbilane synthase